MNTERNGRREREGGDEGERKSSSELRKSKNKKYTAIKSSLRSSCIISNSQGREVDRGSSPKLYTDEQRKTNG